MSDKVHPFEPFSGTDAETFIQWKGTEVCMDFYCPCGVHSHVDAEFAFRVRCPGCGDIYELGTQVKAVRLDPEEAEDGTAVVDAVDHFRDQAVIPVRILESRQVTCGKAIGHGPTELMPLDEREQP